VEDRVANLEKVIGALGRLTIDLNNDRRARDQADNVVFSLQSQDKQDLMILARKTWWDRLPEDGDDHPDGVTLKLATWRCLMGSMAAELEDPETATNASRWLDEDGEGQGPGAQDGEPDMEHTGGADDLGTWQEKEKKTPEDRMKLMMQVLGSLTERNLVRFYGLPRPPASSGDGNLSPWTWILKLDQNTRRGSDVAGALEAAIQSECFSLLGLEVRRDRAPKGYAVRQLETVFYPPRK
jgi:hypothetical protein